MFFKKQFNLQLFADGGAASAVAGAGAATGETGGVAATAGTPNVPSTSRRKSRPDPLANVVYGKQDTKEQSVLDQTSDASNANTQVDSGSSETEHADMSFNELVKSDKYKADYQQAVETLLNQRLKKYKNMETQLDSIKPILDIAGIKYGLDPSSSSFVEDLQKSMNEDKSFYENYAIENGCSVEEARKIVTLERQVKALEQQKQERLNNEQMEKDWQKVVEQSNQTKQKFPNFDLNVEMQDDRFAKLVATGVDTTAAFIATHHDSIIPATVQMATEKATQQVANSVQANKTRPIENGLSPQGASVIKDDPTKLTLNDFRRIRDNFKKTGERPKF